MLVVENEHELERCGRIETLIRYRPPLWSERSKLKRPNSSSDTQTRPGGVRAVRKDYSINRYRKKPDYCHNYYANESKIFFCNSPAATHVPGMASLSLPLFAVALFRLLFVV